MSSWYSIEGRLLKSLQPSSEMKQESTNAERLLATMTEEQLNAFLRSLPDEIITVVGNHLSPGDFQTARLVSKRWREMLRASTVHLHVHPQALTLDAARPLRQARPRLTLSERRRQPTCLQPPVEFSTLADVFPGVCEVTTRIIYRRGERGEGVSTRPDRVQELFTALARVPTLLAAAAQAGSQANPAADTMNEDTDRVSHNKGPKGLTMNISLDIDVPRSRHKEAMAAAQGLATTVMESLSKVTNRLHTLRLKWYDARIAALSNLTTCLETCNRLRRLELPMTPGALLPALSALTALTALKITYVGEVMHMQDTQQPRHTEVEALGSLKRLTELHLDGWVCEMTLQEVLHDLTALTSLAIGEELQETAQRLPLSVLTRLRCISLPPTLSLSLLEDATTAAGGQTTSPTATSVPCLELPRLERMTAAPPWARIQGVASGTKDGDVPMSGAARRRAKSPVVLCPALKDFAVDLQCPFFSHTQSGPMDFGPLPTLQTLHIKITGVQHDDAQLIVPAVEAMQQGHLPSIKGLHFETIRAHQLPPPAILTNTQLSVALREAASAGRLNSLTSFRLTRMWDGLVPDGWDYTTKAGRETAPLPGTRLGPSSLLPRQHLSFLTGLPNLTVLTLHCDRIRLSLLPTALTKLDLEGLVQIDSGPAEGALRCPKLKSLSVLLAKHPRTVPVASASAAPAASSGRATPPIGAPPLPKRARRDSSPSPALISTGASASQALASQALDASSSGAATSSHIPGPSTHTSTTPLFPGGSTGATSGALEGLLGSIDPSQRKTRGDYSVLADLAPVLPETLTSLSYTATPSPQLQRLEQYRPEDYGVQHLTRLTQLRKLGMYVMPKFQSFVDCRQLQGLSVLTTLRTLDLESPLTGATRLACLTALSVLTQLTQLVTGHMDDQTYTGHVNLSGCTPDQRQTVLAYATDLIAHRFGHAWPLTAALDTGGGADAGPSGDPPARRTTRSASPAAAPAGAGPAAGGGEAGGAAGAGGGEDEPGALVGSDVEIHSEDLLFSDGEDDDDVSSDEYVYEPDE